MRIAALLMLLLPACAAVPELPICDFGSYQWAQTERGLAILLHKEEAVKLQQGIKDLAAGKCRVPV